MKKQPRTGRKSILVRERLRRRYRPKRVQILFIGEAPPVSGRFFYQADSGLYRAVRDTFIRAFPTHCDEDFLNSFSRLGCYLVDLCGKPVDHLDNKQRKKACAEGEARLGRAFQQLHPKVVITVVRSIAGNVQRVQQKANWAGTYLELPYPGRWWRHRIAFEKTLVPVLHKYCVGLESRLS